MDEWLRAKYFTYYQREWQMPGVSAIFLLLSSFLARSKVDWFNGIEKLLQINRFENKREMSKSRSLRNTVYPHKRQYSHCGFFLYIQSAHICRNRLVSTDHHHAVSMKQIAAAAAGDLTNSARQNTVEQRRWTGRLILRPVLCAIIGVSLPRASSEGKKFNGI